MILTGLARIGRDAEMRTTSSGEQFATMPLAFSYNNGKSTQWIDVAIFGKRSQSLVNHLKKGTLVDVVITNPHVNTWAKKDGTTGFNLTGRVADLEFAGGAQSPAPTVNPAPSQYDDIIDDTPF